MHRDDNGSRNLFQSIAEIGSIEFQRKWCVHGTSKEYLLLDELLETAIHRAKHNAVHPVLSKKLTDAERHSLLTFHDRANELFDLIPWSDPDVATEDIVERNEAMKQIREAANDCLRELGLTFTLNELLEK